MPVINNSNGWENFYAEGEGKIAGTVHAELPNNSMFFNWKSNDLAETPPNGGVPELNENSPVMVKVRAYERMAPANNGPTIQGTRRRR